MEAKKVSDQEVREGIEKVITECVKHPTPTGVFDRARIMGCSVSIGPGGGENLIIAGIGRRDAIKLLAGLWEKADRDRRAPLSDLGISYAAKKQMTTQMLESWGREDPYFFGGTLENYYGSVSPYPMVKYTEKGGYREYFSYGHLIALDYKCCSCSRYGAFICFRNPGREYACGSRFCTTLCMALNPHNHAPSCSA